MLMKDLGIDPKRPEYVLDLIGYGSVTTSTYVSLLILLAASHSCI